MIFRAVVGLEYFVFAVNYGVSLVKTINNERSALLRNGFSLVVVAFNFKPKFLSSLLILILGLHLYWSLLSLSIYKLTPRYF